MTGTCSLVKIYNTEMGSIAGAGLEHAFSGAQGSRNQANRQMAPVWMVQEPRIGMAAGPLAESAERVKGSRGR